MKHDIAQRPSAAIVGRRKKFALIAILLATASGGAPAEEVVEAGPNLVQNLLSQINTYMQRYQDEAEYAEQFERWRQTYAHYQQQIVRIKGIVTSFNLPRGQALNEVQEDYLVKQRCGVSGVSLSQLVGFDATGNLLQQQRQLCASMQVLRNRRYNETVAFLKETLPEMEQSLKQASQRRDASNDQGNVSASQDDSVRIANEFAVKFQAWESRTQLYDRYLVAIGDAQKGLAERALRGERRALGTVLQTAALKHALDLD